MFQLLLEIARLVESPEGRVQVMQPIPWPVPGETWITTYVGRHHVMVGIHAGLLYAAVMLPREP